MDMVRMSIREMKLDDITVTGQPMRPSNPIMITTANTQLHRGSRTKRACLKMIDNMITRKANTPAPNTTRSFLMNVIMSSAIMGIPPR